MARYGLAAALATLAFAAQSAQAQIIQEVDEITDIEIDEHLGESIPLNLRFTNEKGQEVVLADLFSQERPVIMQMIYLNCPMLCTMVVNGTLESLEKNGMVLGRDFDMISVSFVEDEDYNLAYKKKHNYLKGYQVAGDSADWHMLTGRNPSIEPLRDALGFKYKWVENTQEYAHASAIFILSPEGRIARYLYGVQYDPQTLKYSLREASEGRTLSTTDRVFLYCFQYDHVTGQYSPLAMNIMRVAAVLTLLFIGILISMLWGLERGRRRGDGGDGDGGPGNDDDERKTMVTA